MARRNSRRTKQAIAYAISAVVALTMILSLIGPILFREPASPTPTWPPTWTAWPTFTPSTAPTQTPDVLPTNTAAPAPTMVGPPPPPTPSPTVTPTVTIEPVTGALYWPASAAASDSGNDDEADPQALDRATGDGSRKNAAFQERHLANAFCHAVQVTVSDTWVSSRGARPG